MITPLLKVLFSFAVFAHSSGGFLEKPTIPVFNKGGKNVVILECYGLSQKNQVTKIDLVQTDHPKIFTTKIPLEKASLVLKASQLKQENSISLNLIKENLWILAAESYGEDVTLKYKNLNITCSIFDGETEEN